MTTNTVTMGGARGVVVIVVGNGHGNTSSNPHSTNTLGEGMNPIIYIYAYTEIYICICKYKCINVYIHVCMQIYMYINMYIYTNIYVYTNIYEELSFELTRKMWNECEDILLQLSFTSYGVVVKALDCRIVENEFALQSRYCFHFWANTLRYGVKHFT